VVPPSVLCRILLLGLRNSTSPSEPCFLCPIHSVFMEILLLQDKSGGKSPHQVFRRRLCRVSPESRNEDPVHRIDTTCNVSSRESGLFTGVESKCMVIEERNHTACRFIPTTNKIGFWETLITLWQSSSSLKRRYHPRIYGYPCSAHDMNLGWRQLIVKRYQCHYLPG